MSGSVINRTVGFPLGSVAETEIAFYKTPLGDGLFSYARRENPTVSDCERVLAGIEGAECCLLTSCSMASINIVLSVFNDPADRRPWLFPADVYSGTLQYATEILRGQRGVNVRIAEPAGRNSTTSNLIDAIEDQAPALVFVEPVTNPLLDIVDVPAAAAAHGQGAAVVVDNTFGTPYLFHPLDAGADVVVHSATKYLGGHNYILAGAIGVNDPDLRARFLKHRNIIGSVLSPDDAGRLKTQLQTFSLRLARQNATAMEIAAYLDNYPGVAKVRASIPWRSRPGADHVRKPQVRRHDHLRPGAERGRQQPLRRRPVTPLPPIGSLGDVATTFLHVKACFGEDYDPSTIRLSVVVSPDVV
jgi:cystathionine beta-lyase/cystathionine gamma-synthase